MSFVTRRKLSGAVGANAGVFEIGDEAFIGYAGNFLKSICEYRRHGNIDRGVLEAGEHDCEPLRMFGYFLVTLDGHEMTIDEAAPDLVAEIECNPYSETFFASAENI